MERSNPTAQADGPDWLNAVLYDAGVASVASVEALPERNTLPDATRKFLGYDHANRVTGFLLLSAEVAPDMVARAVARARDVRKSLPAELRGPVMLPLHAGYAGSRSYALFPIRKEMRNGRLSRRMDLWRYGRPVLDWLADAVRATCRPAADESLAEAFERPLCALEDDDWLPADMRRCAAETTTEMQSGRWNPRLAMMHNDFWWGNVLQAPPDFSGGFGFQIIDWAGSTPRGYPVYDLMRMAESQRLSVTALRQRLSQHAAVLQCDPVQLRNYLCVALGYLRMNLEQFPHERYARMADSIWQRLNAALQ